MDRRALPEQFGICRRDLHGQPCFFADWLLSGIAVGAGVVIARYYGAKDEKKLDSAIHTTIAFGLICGVVLSVVGVLLTPKLLQLMKTDTSYFQYSVEYFRYYFLGALSIVMYNLGMGVLRAVGDSKSPLYYLIISSLVNIGLDYLFVGVFDWGVWSAALATSISQLLSAILCVIRLAKGGEGFQFQFRRLRIEGPMLKEIIRYGLPSGIQNSIIAFANVVVQSNINTFHEDTVAGCGTYSKLEGFAFLPITCYTMALTTFVSQNLGAGQHDRAKKGSVFGIFSCVIIAELIGVALLIFARPLLAFFTNNEAAIEVGIRQIRVEALFYCVLAFSHCIAAIMRGAGKPMIPMFVMLGAWCVLRVAYISIVVPIVGKSWVIFSAYPLTWTCSSIVFLIFYLKSDWIHGFDKKAALPHKR